MAQSTPVKKAWRSLIWLGVIVALLFGGNAAQVIFGDAEWTPKLALDLEGGTQIILAPQVQEGETVTQEQLDQAVAIIRQRIDASGVSEAEINTQGGTNIVVSIPGTPDQETLNRIEASAQLEFRAVLLTDAATTSTATSTGTDTASPSDPATPAPDATPTATPTDGSDLAWITPALQSEYDTFDCSSDAAQDAGQAPKDEPLVACDPTGTVKYLLGPVEVSGSTISDASASQVTNSQGVATGGWAVNIVFDAEGTEQFGDVTSRLYPLDPPRNQFGIVLDGVVISAPATNAVITDGKPQITGSFTQAEAQTLADQLKFGALPISFVVQSSDTISATLGQAQLLAGLLAGAIGLLLVVIYSVIQYKALGSVTIASLVVSGVITYFIINILSWQQGYRLSLAGVAGLIVAIGITADSFIVYFERIRDELRDGRRLVSAVEVGWKRALRTIIASDSVNFLAAAVLYILAVGSVRGFAYTLGITTIVDLVVVMLFTHPVMQLLANTRFFGEGHRFSGLDPKALGAVYRGRGQFRDPVAVSAGKKASSSKEAAKRQTIAERKAAEAAAATTTPAKKSGKDS